MSDAYSPNYQAWRAWTEDEIASRLKEALAELAATGVSFRMPVAVYACPASMGADGIHSPGYILWDDWTVTPPAQAISTRDAPQGYIMEVDVNVPVDVMVAAAEHFRARRLARSPITKGVLS